MREGRRGEGRSLLRRSSASAARRWSQGWEPFRDTRIEDTKRRHREGRQAGKQTKRLASVGRPRRNKQPPPSSRWSTQKGQARRKTILRARQRQTTKHSLSQSNQNGGGWQRAQAHRRGQYTNTTAAPGGRTDYAKLRAASWEGAAPRLWPESLPGSRALGVAPARSRATAKTARDKSREGIPPY